MSRSNYDKPFYVDVGTSIVAVRCASNHDVVLEYDHSRHPFVIELAEKACDRMNREAGIGRPRGEFAKLREALIKARSAICEFAKYQCDSLKWENSNLQANCGDILCSWRGLCEAKTAINAAIAAPMRNCDRFQTKEDAAMAFNKERSVFIPQSLLWQLGEWLDWLFAPATEKEGGNDGSK